MKSFFPHMYDSPENNQVVGSLSYGIVAFVVLPFTFTLFFFERNSEQVYVVLEYIYQGMNAAMMLAIFRAYLRDSWLNVSIAPRRVLGYALGAAGVILGLYLEFLKWAAAELFESAGTVFFGALPMTGIELMLLPGDFALFGGIPAMLFLVVLGPVLTACMFYATAFAPVCASGRRTLAYFAVAVLLAVPRVITSFTVWGGWKEGALYLAQLPIHWLACWTYEQTDTVWAPIFTLTFVNLLSCVILFAMKLTLIIG